MVTRLPSKTRNSAIVMTERKRVQVYTLPGIPYITRVNSKQLQLYGVALKTHMCHVIRVAGLNMVENNTDHEIPYSSENAKSANRATELMRAWYITWYN